LECINLQLLSSVFFFLSSFNMANINKQ